MKNWMFGAYLMIVMKMSLRQALCQSPMITSGKEFVLAFPIPEDMDVENHRLLFVSNPSSSSAATVTVAVPKEQNAAGLKNISDHQVRPVSSVVMSYEMEDVIRVKREDRTTEGLKNVDRHQVPPVNSIVMSYGMKDDVIHVISDQDIVVQIVVLSEDNGTTPMSSAATLIYPTSTLHKKYWVSSTCNSSRCFITIVAAEEGETTVNVTVRVEPQGQSVFFEGTRYQNNSVINHEIQQFQVMRLQCEDPQCDLSGTRVRSSKPVAVFVGADYRTTDFRGDVVFYEQIPPTLFCHRKQKTHGSPNRHRCLPAGTNYKYILAPLWKDKNVGELKVVDYSGDTTVRLTILTVRLGRTDLSTSTERKKVDSLNIPGNDTEVQTLTADRRVILMQTTRLVGSGALMPLPVNFWASSCFLALPEDDRLPEDMEVEVVILLSSWAEDCLHTTDEDVLVALEEAMSETGQWAQVGQLAVVRAHVDRGTRAVIHSRCGPISAYLSAWSLQHGWTMALGSVRSMMDTTSASSSPLTDCTKVRQTTTSTSKHTAQPATQPQPTRKTRTTHTATTDTHVTDPTTTNLLSSQPVTGKPVTAQPVTTKLVSDPPTVTTPQTAEPGISPTAHQVTAEETSQSESPAAPVTKKKPFLCPCSGQVRAKQQSSAAKPVAWSGPERQTVEKAIRQKTSKALAVNKTTLSRTRRSKLSEGDVKIAYGIGIGLVLLTMLQMLHSAYQVQKYGTGRKQVKRGKIEPLEKRDDRSRHKKRSKAPRKVEQV